MGLIVYQVEDSLDFVLPSRSVDLVISSVPIDVLADRLNDLFLWVESCIKPDGVFIIDCPSIYHDWNYNLNRYTVGIFENRVKTFLKSRFSLALYDVYCKGDLQSLYFYSAREIPSLDKLDYRKCTEREMAHSCEFDHLMISELIKLYSEKGYTVLDPFCGIGVVPRMAHRLGRDGIGMDRRCPFTNELPEDL